MSRLFVPVFIALSVLASCTVSPSNNNASSSEPPVVTPTPAPVVIYQLTINQTNAAEEIIKDPVTAAGGWLVISNGNTEMIASNNITIEGRGNSTWYYSFNNDPKMKLPYKIKLKGTTPDMLGMGVSSTWVLLANRFDKTLMKNILAFDTAQALSFQFVNRYRLVELTLNGIYQGLYLITDQVEVDGTLRVQTGTTNPGSDTDPGFLVELDQKITLPPEQGGDGGTNGIQYFRIGDIPFAFKYPKVKDLDKVAGNAARLSISNFMALTMTAVSNSTTGSSSQHDWKTYIDPSSFYDFFIVNELAKNTDAADYSSIYLTRPKNGKLMMGPVWDFDIAFGWLDGVKSPTGWYILEKSPIYSVLIPRNTEFRQGLKARWNEVKTVVYQKMVANIDYYEGQLNAAAGRNHGKWGELGQHITIWDNDQQQYPNPETDYASVVAYLRQFAKTRYNWLDTAINNL